MKKLILSLALACCVTLVSYSQLFNIGIKAGYNSSLSINDLEYNPQDFKDDFFGNAHIGAFARFNFGKIYVQPELLYSLQTKNYTVNTQNNNTTGSIKYDYKMRAIDVPVLAGYKILDFKLVNLRVFAGPKFRFDAGSSLNLNSIIEGDITEDDLKHDVKSAKVGLEAGLGLDALMFTFDVRYNLIGNLSEASWQDAGNAIKGIPSSTILFTLGWKIL